MNKTDITCRAELRKRFSDRQELGKEQVYEQFFAERGLPRSKVLELLETIELEFGVSAGLLRPSDRLAKLATPVHPHNIWQWMVFQVRTGDTQLALYEALDKRLKRSGRKVEWRDIETLDDLAAVWCAVEPPVSARAS